MSNGNDDHLTQRRGGREVGPSGQPTMSRWPSPTEKTPDLQSDSMTGKIKSLAGGTLGPRAGNNSDAGKKPNENLR